MTKQPDDYVPDDYMKAYAEILEALGSERVTALDDEQRLNLYVNMIHAMVDRVATQGTVANSEEALALILFRLQLGGLEPHMG